MKRSEYVCIDFPFNCLMKSNVTIWVVYSLFGGDVIFTARGVNVRQVESKMQECRSG